LEARATFIQLQIMWKNFVQSMCCYCCSYCYYLSFSAMVILSGNAWKSYSHCLEKLLE